MQIDPALDAEYDARGSVADFDAERAALVALSEAARQALPVRQDLVYDPESGMALDLYGAEAETRAVLLWVHGGYWRAGNKADNGFAASGLVSHGVAVAVMDYSLAPEASLAEIIQQVRKAVGWLYHEGPSMGLDTRRIHVAGSSAGGHLAAMMLCEGWHGELGLPTDVVGAVLGLSGLYDLAPLRKTRVNEWLGLDPLQAAALSPIRHIPRSTGARLLLSVGGRETAAFQRQTADFAAAWQAAGHPVHSLEMNDFNHFNISGTMADPRGVLVRGLAEEITACVVQRAGPTRTALT